jgi:glycosyltransferase involved in cell wall biosynthesis
LKANTDLLIHHKNSKIVDKVIDNAFKISKRYSCKIERLDQTSLNRSIIVKPYISNNEKGILIVSFETELFKLIKLINFKEIVKRYNVVFMPTWQPFYSPEIFLYIINTERPLYIMPSSFDENKIVKKFNGKIRYLPFHAASWVNHNKYSEKLKKDNDLLMVANFGKHKRHWLLFQAMSKMPNDVKACIIGVPTSDRKKENLIKEAKLFGIYDKVKIIERATNDELLSMLLRSKLFCALTYREGSYVSVAEAIISDTPVAMFSNAYIGTKAYINQKTGEFLSPKKDLSKQLVSILKNHSKYSPREWGIKNISAEINSKKFSKIMLEYSIKDKEQWTNGLESIYCERFDFFYNGGIKTEKKYRHEYRELKEKYGLKIIRPIKY